MVIFLLSTAVATKTTYTTAIRQDRFKIMFLTIIQGSLNPVIFFMNTAIFLGVYHLKRKYVQEKPYELFARTVKNFHTNGCSYFAYCTRIIINSHSRSEQDQQNPMLSVCCQYFFLQYLPEIIWHNKQQGNVEFIFCTYFSGWWWCRFRNVSFWTRLLPETEFNKMLVKLRARLGNVLQTGTCGVSLCHKNGI